MHNYMVTPIFQMINSERCLTLHSSIDRLCSIMYKKYMFNSTFLLLSVTRVMLVTNSYRPIKQPLVKVLTWVGQVHDLCTAVIEYTCNMLCLQFQLCTPFHSQCLHYQSPQLKWHLLYTSCPTVITNYWLIQRYSTGFLCT